MWLRVPETRVMCSGKALLVVHVGGDVGVGPNPEKLGRGWLPGGGGARLEFCRHG